MQRKAITGEWPPPCKLLAGHSRPTGGLLLPRAQTRQQMAKSQITHGRLVEGTRTAGGDQDAS
eukprot:6058968-Prorocentrum_lima.AAC.1